MKAIHAVEQPVRRGLPHTRLLRQRHRGLLWGLLLVGLAACSGAPEPQALRFDEPPWQPDEASVYQITASDETSAGRARYDLNLLEPGVWSLRRETSAQGTQEIVVVEMEEPGFRPTMSTLLRMDSEGAEQVRSTYARGQVDMEITTRGDVTTTERRNIPSDARDRRTLAMIVRALPLAERYATQINSYLPVAPLLERVTVVVTGREEVTAPAGTFECWRVELRTPNGESEVWIGVEAPHPVVRYVDSRNNGLYELMEFMPTGE